MPGNERISQLPPSIKSLSKLMYLDASGHFIKSVEGFFKKMSDLKYLNLSVNKIEKFPKDVVCQLILTSVKIFHR